MTQKRDKPKFPRQHAHSKKRTGGKKAPWRKPRGIDSAQKRHKKSLGAHPRIGYGQPKSIRGKHPTGVVEVLVHNLKELELVGEGMAARISRTVGARKKAAIEKAAQEKKIRVLNSGTQ